MIGCNLIGAATLDEALGRIAAYAAAHPETGVDRGQRLADGMVRRTVRPTASCSTRSPAAGPPTSPTATATAPGPAPARSSWPASTPAPRPAGRPDRARAADGTPAGHRCTRARPTWSAPSCRRPPSTTGCAGLLLAQQHLHARGHHRLAGRDHRRLPRLAGPAARLPGRGRGRAADRAGAGRAVVGPRPGRSSSCPSILARREHGQAGRFRASTVKIMQDGVAENFTAGMLEPYLDSCGCQTANRGPVPRRPGASCAST